MKKLSLCIITALSLVSLGILTACGVSATPKEAGSAQLPNPFIPCASIEDANEILGFTAAVPSILPDGYETAAIAAVWESPNGFVVCHVKRISNAPAWKRAGRDEQTYSRY